MKRMRGLIVVVGLGIGVVSWPILAQNQGPDLERRVLMLEVALANVQATADRAAAALETNAELRQQLIAAREMATAAVNGQNEVLRKAQAIVDRASGSRAEIEDLRARLGSLEASLAAQASLVSSIDRSPMESAPPAVARSIASASRERIVYLGDAREMVDVAPVAAAIGPCPALRAGNPDAWQAALQSFGGGLTFESVDLEAQMALIRTAKGNREAISASDVLSRSGCL